MRPALITIVLCFFGGTLASQKTITYQVILRSDFGQDTMWDGNVMRIYALTPALGATPSLPARTLYANEGDTVILNARSVAQGDHHTIHLHGLDVDTRNDGDPATSFWLSHMQDTTYTFIAQHAGTYLYHCHVGDVVHVQMGMYGLIVVKAAGGLNTAWTGGPAFNSYRNWLTSEIDERWHDTIPEHDTTGIYIQLPPYVPNYFLINGKSETELDMDDSIRVIGSQNEVIYLRVGNIGFFDNKIIFPPALDAIIIDSDGRPLPSSIESDTLLVSPGERYGVLLRPQSQFVDSIQVQYINMNTGVNWSTQFVPVIISGYFGVDQQPALDFRMYPNPTSGNLTIQLSDFSCDAISITDVFGRPVLTTPVQPNEHEMKLNVPGLLPGTYFVELQCDSGNIGKKLLLLR